MANAEYWKRRFKLIEEAQHQQGLQCYANIEKQYFEAQKQIESKINAWYQRFADNNQISLIEARRLLNTNELEELRWNVDEYIRYGKANAVSKEWMKELENASAKAHISRLESIKLQMQQSLEVLFGNQLDIVDTAIRDIYGSGYLRTAFEIQKGIGVGWSLSIPNDNLIAKVINKPWAADGRNFSDRIWANKQKLINELNATFTQNIITGADPRKTIDVFSRKLDVSKQNAGRLVMTEQAAFGNTAQHDCFKALDVEQFEVVETLDSHTCSLCGSMDGKHFPMSQFEVGMTAPPFHPNCRGCTCPYFDDEFDSVGKRAARGENGKTYYVPNNTTYVEWKESFCTDSEPKEKFSAMNMGAVKTELKKYETEFSKLTDGYSYDDFMKDFGSIEDGFDGASQEEMKKAKEIAEKIEYLKANNQIKDLTHAREESVKALQSLGINFEESSPESITDELLWKYTDFISGFEKSYPKYFAKNKQKLSAISVVDNIKGVSANGIYRQKSSTIEIKLSGISSKLGKGVSKSDDGRLHTLAHEYGHYIADTLEKNNKITEADVIQEAINRYFDGDIFKSPKDLKECLSAYGSTSYSEAFAEAFAEAYTCKEPRKFAKIFREELEKYFAS